MHMIVFEIAFPNIMGNTGVKFGCWNAHALAKQSFQVTPSHVRKGDFQDNFWWHVRVAWAADWQQLQTKALLQKKGPNNMPNASD